MFLNIIFIFSLIYSIMITYGCFNLLKKTELYEDRIIFFEHKLEDILAKCRTLDKKQMFEKDDEVGILFQKLIGVIGELRIVLYGKTTEEEIENTEI